MAELIRVKTESAATGLDSLKALSVAGIAAHLAPGPAGIEVEIDDPREDTAHLVREIQRVLVAWAGERQPPEPVIRILKRPEPSARQGASTGIGTSRHAGLVLLPALLALALLLAGCGSDSGGSAAPETTAETTVGGAGTTLEIDADPSGKLEFDKTRLEAPAGKVTIMLTNDSSIDHNVAIEGDGVDVESETVKDGGKTSVTAELKPGTYTFYCSVPGHEEAGMKGALIVK
jgi:plastocyanin